MNWMASAQSAPVPANAARAAALLASDGIK